MDNLEIGNVLFEMHDDRRDALAASSAIVRDEPESDWCLNPRRTIFNLTELLLLMQVGEPL